MVPRGRLNIVSEVEKILFTIEEKKALLDPRLKSIGLKDAVVRSGTTDSVAYYEWNFFISEEDLHIIGAVELTIYDPSYEDSSSIVSVKLTAVSPRVGSASIFKAIERVPMEEVSETMFHTISILLEEISNEKSLYGNK